MKPESKYRPVGFPIVGIGASAGGLEALEQFLGHVPKDSGMAFVIIQHLDPTHKGIMVELLQRATPMPVIQVADRTRIKPNHVYVIPPNKDMSVLHGVLHLLTPMAPRGLRLPIDFFFRSLAEDQREHSVGVILSGMGSDGALGLRAIKEEAGVVFVQEPATAKFDGMPRSAEDAGLADVIAPAEELPARIIAYIKHVPLLTPKPGLAADEKAQSALDKIVILLRAHTGHDFSLYKKSTVYRRIERRMGIHQIDKIADYVRFLRENPKELQLLFGELLIGVTSFFRDPMAWEQLKNRVLPDLLANCQTGHMLRAWIPGCSTGEEAYSLAIVFKEAMDKLKSAKNLSLQIFATDLDRDAVKKACEGAFPANIATDVSAERLNRFFIQVERGYLITKPIREMIIFAPQNLIMDPPFTKLDILSCRNLLIYLTPELQKKLLPLFHYSLNPGGYLFLGSAESIGGSNDLFIPLDGKSRIYRRSESAQWTKRIEFPQRFVPSHVIEAESSTAISSTANLQTLADQVIIKYYSPPAVLVNDSGDILYVNGRTGKYLEPPAGKANWNIYAMTREGLRYELASAFQKAICHKQAVTLKNMKVANNGGTQTVNVAIQPLAEPETLQGLLLIAFHDVAMPPLSKSLSAVEKYSAHNRRVRELEGELEQARQETQTTREEMQTSQEELKSTNEELQSTNEELTTSKEEMQSMNEELQTLNQELQAKVDELSQASNDMKNLLDSTDIATLFLNGNLNVRRYTPQATRIFKLIPSDVGRPITDITTDLIYSDFAEDVKEVLRTLVFLEKEVTTRDGRWFVMRIMPYRTLENRIDGVVITFVNISVMKKMEMEWKRNTSGKVVNQKT